MKSNFQIYKDEINRLLIKTQIGGDWEIEIKIDNSDEERLANCSWDTGGRYVSFGLNEKQNKKHKRTDNQILKSARHEFGHFVIARMEALATSRFIDKGDIDDESERIARIFERLF